MNRASRRPPGELARLARLARQQGWRLERRTKHWFWWPPDGGPPVATNSTPSGGRGDGNTRARLIRAGLVVRRGS